MRRSGRQLYALCPAVPVDRICRSCRQFSLCRYGCVESVVLCCRIARPLHVRCLERIRRSLQFVVVRTPDHIHLDRVRCRCCVGIRFRNVVFQVGCRHWAAERPQIAPAVHKVPAHRIPRHLGCCQNEVVCRIRSVRRLQRLIACRCRCRIKELQFVGCKVCRPILAFDLRRRIAVLRYVLLIRDDVLLLRPYCRQRQRICCCGPCPVVAHSARQIVYRVCRIRRPSVVFARCCRRRLPSEQHVAGLCRRMLCIQRQTQRFVDSAARYIADLLLGFASVQIKADDICLRIDPGRLQRHVPDISGCARLIY